MISNAEASRNILAFAESGRLIQQQWRCLDAEGREVACLLGAIHPSVDKPEDCNAELMPLWLAELTPPLFDGIPPTEISQIAMRYGALINRWDRISDAGWRSILKKFLIYVVDQAVNAAEPVNKDQEYWIHVKSACEHIKAAIASEDKDAQAAAMADAWTARAAAGDARSAMVAAETSWIAAWASGETWAIAWAAWAVAWATAEAAEAFSWASTGVAAWAVARVAWGDWADNDSACLRLFNFLLDQIDEQIGTSSETA